MQSTSVLIHSNKRLSLLMLQRMFSNEANPDRFSTGTPTPDNRFGQIPNMTTN